MKAKKLAPLALLLPLTLLAACGGTPEIDLYANWYANEVQANILSESEELSYEVTYTPASNAEPLAVFEYETGSYKTVLQEHSSLAIYGASGTGYSYHTEFSIAGRYTFGGKTTEFTDSIVSDVVFTNVKDLLRPIKSIKEYHVTTSYGGSVIRYDYIYTAAYNEKLTETEIAVRDLRENVKEEDKLDFTKKMKLKGGGTFLDNEEILFALRGLDYTSAYTFRTVNPVTRERMSVAMTSAPKEVKYKGSFLLNGEETGEIELTAATFAIGYTSDRSGLTQTLTYASTPSGRDLRHALVEMKTQAPDGYGTFTYKLTELSLFKK